MKLEFSDRSWCIAFQQPFLLWTGFSSSVSLRQAEFCDEDCVERYLKARGNNVRRAARLLKATLNWREKINIGKEQCLEPALVLDVWRTFVEFSSCADRHIDDKNWALLFAGYLIADEFPAELATGTAYVAGLDDDGRPVLVGPLLFCLWLEKRPPGPSLILSSLLYNDVTMLQI